MDYEQRYNDALARAKEQRDFLFRKMKEAGYEWNKEKKKEINKVMKLIDKDALVAEINKRIIDAPINYIGHQRVWAYNDVKDILNTLEVKEIDE